MNRLFIPALLLVTALGCSKPCEEVCVGTDLGDSVVVAGGDTIVVIGGDSVMVGGGDSVTVAGVDSVVVIGGDSLAHKTFCWLDWKAGTPSGRRVLMTVCKKGAAP